MSGYFDFLATHPNYPRLVQREAMESSRNFGWIVRAVLAALSQSAGAERFKKESRRREFRAVDPDHTALSILGMTTSYFAAAPILSEIVGRDLLAPRSVEARKRALIDFLDHGLNSESRRARQR